MPASYSLAAYRRTSKQHPVHREDVGPGKHNGLASNMCCIVLHVCDGDGAIGNVLEAQRILRVAQGAEGLCGARWATSRQALT
jgi:hypothetical protein